MNLPILAVVVPCYNEELVINEAVKKINSVINMLVIENVISIKSFIVFVDDGSRDNTWNLIESFGFHFENIRGLKLSRNQGHQNALIAGMEFAKDRCDCLISIDADLQQDEGLIPAFITEYMNGSEVVIGVRNDRASDSLFKKLTATVFYKLMISMGVNIIKNHADFRLLSNKANSALLEHKEVNLFLRGLIPLIGFRTGYVYFDVKYRLAGKSKYTLFKMLSLAIDGVTSFSVTPLRLVSFMGVIIFSASILMSIYIISYSFFTDKAIPGWASTVIPIYFMGGVQLLSIGVLGEYIGKIYSETKKRPRYFIDKEI